MPRHSNENNKPAQNVSLKRTGNRGRPPKNLSNATSSPNNGRHAMKPPKIKKVVFGMAEIIPWYQSPYPAEYYTNRDGILYYCDLCLKFTASSYKFHRHVAKCRALPPGDEIYRDGSISVFEIDGQREKSYCQSLCLLAKMFLDHKTLYYDVEPFLFYVLVEWSFCYPPSIVSINFGIRSTFAGYFSKEKASPSNNLSCILTMPHHQRKGFGFFLIDFSYLLSKRENKPGGPEKPLSDLGLLSYKSYWRSRLLDTMSECKFAPMSLNQLSQRTLMSVDDVATSLEWMDALLKIPSTGEYVIAIDPKYLNEHQKRKAKAALFSKEENLVWTPLPQHVTQIYQLPEVEESQ